jgi:hypothetical protein
MYQRLFLVLAMGVGGYTGRLWAQTCPTPCTLCSTGVDNNVFGKFSNHECFMTPCKDCSTAASNCLHERCKACGTIPARERAGLPLLWCCVQFEYISALPEYWRVLRAAQE